jgi:hypothetical protein
VPWPTDSPESYFAARELALHLYETDAGDWSADIVSEDRTITVRERYGSGASADQAALSAQRRYHVEEEPDPPLPHRLP